MRTNELDVLDSGIHPCLCPILLQNMRVYIIYIYNEHMYTIGPRGSHVRLCQKEHDTIVYDVYIYILYNYYILKCKSSLEMMDVPYFRQFTEGYTSICFSYHIYNLRS